MALMSCFLEKVWLKLVLFNIHHPPLFPVNLSPLRFCSVARNLRPFVAEEKWKLKRCVAVTFRATERHPGSPELPGHALLRSRDQVLLAFASPRCRGGGAHGTELTYISMYQMKGL